MKRFPASCTLVAVLLLGILIMLSPAPLALAATPSIHVTIPASSASHQGSGPGPIFRCLGPIAFTVAATLLDKEKLSFGEFASSVPTCIDSALTLFNNPPTSASSSPEVDINSSPSDGALNGSVQSAPVENCTDYRETLRFDFYVPFKMIVGPPENQGVFNGSPNGSTDNELIARQLFGQYSSYIAGNTTSGPSQSAVYDMPPHTRAALNLPIVPYYAFGEARVVRTDGSTVSLPWLFTDTYRQTGAITAYTRSSC